MAKRLRITFVMTEGEALLADFLICTCGHRPNNHFTHGRKPCAHCECAAYGQTARYGGAVTENTAMSMSRAEAKAIEQRVTKALAAMEAAVTACLPLDLRECLNYYQQGALRLFFREGLHEAKSELEAVMEMVTATLTEK